MADERLRRRMIGAAERNQAEQLSDAEGPEVSSGSAHAVPVNGNEEWRQFYKAVQTAMKELRESK